MPIISKVARNIIRSFNDIQCGSTINIAVKSTFPIVPHKIENAVLQSLQNVQKNGSLEYLSKLICSHLNANAVYVDDGPIFNAGWEISGTQTLTCKRTVHIAHSFPHFGGVAARLHGSTLHLEATIRSNGDEDVFLDARELQRSLDEVSERYNNRNLDEDFPGVVTTVEWMGKEICDGLYEHLCPSKLPRLKSIDVNVRESDVASAAYARIYHADTSEYSVRATDRLLVGHKAPDGNSISGSTMIVHLHLYGQCDKFNVLVDISEVRRVLHQLCGIFDYTNLCDFYENPTHEQMCEEFCRLFSEETLRNPSCYSKVSRCKVCIEVSDDVSAESELDLNLESSQMSSECVTFIAPGRVEVQQYSLGAGDILVESELSCISSGTESLIFQGKLCEATKMDTFSDEDLTYPLRFGYCTVGKVVQSLSVANDFNRVFLFAPHGSFHRVAISNVISVPEHIPSADAIFFPNMETAIHLLHDLSPLLGERILIIGQGVVGLLVNAILGDMKADVTCVDLSHERLLASQKMNPDCKTSTLVEGDFDCILEVSGSASGLSEALKHARKGARIIVGSWYSDGFHSMEGLGTKFHRGSVTIASSQVSEIQSQLRDRWSKERRYGLVWEKLASHKPSDVLLTHLFSLSQCQVAYETCSKERDTCIAAAFDYEDNRIGKKHGLQMA